MDLKSAGTAPQAKPPEPSKVDAAPKQSPTVKDAPAAGKPLEQPKAETTPKAPDAALPKEAKPEKAPAGDVKAPADPKAPPVDPSKAPQGDKTPVETPRLRPHPKPLIPFPRKMVNRPKCLNPPIPLIQKRCQRRRMPTPRLKRQIPARPRDDKKDKETKEAENPTAEKSDEAGQHRFIPLSKIHDLPGTYVKDQPKADYSAMIQSIKGGGAEGAGHSPPAGGW